MNNSSQDAVDFLLSPEAIRSRCGQLYRLAQSGELLHFEFVPSKLKSTVEFVVDVIHGHYPLGDIPFHSRLRHFEAGGINRVSEFKKLIETAPPDEQARSWFDLVTISVLMDAGAGAPWRYLDPRSGGEYSRSEGLGVLSYNLFCDGWFSIDKSAPFRVDGHRLLQITEQSLATAMTVTPQNPIIGLGGRCQLLKNLGQLLFDKPEVFGQPPRLGNLFHAVTQGQSTLAARDLLRTVLVCLGPMWPSRLTLHGVPLGDTGTHPLVTGEGPTKGLVPFHKLSQWLTYSLMEALALSGVTVHTPDSLTGLAEYRNGGLLLDMGLINLKDPRQKAVTHSIDSPLIVEWRALTVALLDIIADEVRKILGKSERDLPLVKVLEGGTWQAGRKIARMLRPDGSPPLSLVSDGTVF